MVSSTSVIFSGLVLMILGHRQLLVRFVIAVVSHRLGSVATIMLYMFGINILRVVMNRQSLVEVRKCDMVTIIGHTRSYDQQ